MHKPKPRRIVCTMTGSTAALLWQITSTFASLPGLPPTGRLRAAGLARQFLSLSRGEIETDSEPEISSNKDMLACMELEAYQPTLPPMLLTVRISNKVGRELVALRAESAWGIVEAARQAKAQLPAGLFVWLRECQPGDKLHLYDHATGTSLLADSITRAGVGPDESRNHPRRFAPTISEEKELSNV